MEITPAEFVINKLGGLTKTARVCDCPVSTVQGWKDRGRIPQDHWYTLIDAAAAEGQVIDFPDFLNNHSAAETAA